MTETKSRIEKGSATNANRAPFALGRSAFKKISAVDGIAISCALDTDLQNLAHAASDQRRAILTAKYGRRQPAGAPCTPDEG